jgi:hypothetical protein
VLTVVLKEKLKLAQQDTEDMFINSNEDENAEEPT